MTKQQLLLVLAVLAAPVTVHAGGLDATNLAFGRPARQSSVYPGGDPSHAVDGNSNPNWSGGSVALTNYDAHPWWEVDLGAVRQIGRIEITPRADWGTERLYPYMVIVSDYPLIDTDITDSDANSWAFLVRTKVDRIINTIPINRSGRYVRIALLQQDYLQLAEVKVLESFNAAQGRPATQSSVQNGADASRAVNGLTSGITGGWAGGDNSITNWENKPWWQVDLGFVQTLREVHIWSSNADCCATANPRKGLWVFASVNPFWGDPFVTYQPGVSTFYVPAQGAPAVLSLNVDARYVRVQLDGSDSLSLSEVQVWAAARGATGGHVSMSSVAPTSEPATTAIDYNLNTGEIATQQQTDNYFDLDLGASRYVSSVRLWNSPTASVVGQLYTLAVSDTPFVVNGAPATTLAATQAVPGVTTWLRRGNTQTASTTAVMRRARYIRVIQSTSIALTGIREVEVVGNDSIVTSNANARVNYSDTLQMIFSGYGYAARPNAPIYIYTWVPAASGGYYYYLGSATSSATPTLTWFANAPLYVFSSPDFSLYPFSWPAGSLSGLYYITYDDDPQIYAPLRTLDADGSFSPFYPDIRMVSASPSPDDNVTKPKYLDSPMGKWVKPDYGDADFPTTLAAFKTKFFPAGGTSSAARFYNKNELGIGREVRCAHESWLSVVTQTPKTVTGTVCLVQNYGPGKAGVYGVSNAVLTFGDQSTSLAQMATGTPFDSAVIILRDGSSQPFFGFYDNLGKASLYAPHDNSLHQTYLPNNCMACHGGSGAIVAANTDHWFVSTGTLLPIDPSQMVYADSPYTYAQQVESIRQLNAIVLGSNPKPAVAQLINGLYPAGVNVAGSQPNSIFMPKTWNATESRRKIYNEVVKPHCRMCHLSQEPSAGGLDLTSADDFEAMRALILYDACNAKRMPHAQQTMKNFWGSSARAYLLGFLGRHDIDLEACSP